MARTVYPCLMVTMSNFLVRNGRQLYYFTFLETQTNIFAFLMTELQRLNSSHKKLKHLQANTWWKKDVKNHGIYVLDQNAPQYVRYYFMSLIRFNTR